MKCYRLFFSWQADRPDVRNTIRKAIDESIRLLKKDGLDVYVDQDTRDRTGTQDIGAEVQNKIRNCDAFLADLSPVTSYESDGSTKLVPNSNVMFELGYANGTIGMDRCILIAKTGEGEKPNQFPFDINHYTIKTFSDSKRLPDLSPDIKKVLEAAEKRRLETQNQFGCAVVFENGKDEFLIRPEFRRVIRAPKGAAVPDTVTIEDTWTNRRTPSFRLSSNGAIATPISEEINLSLPKINLSLFNSGKEALDNCEIRLSSNDRLVRFRRNNVHSAYFPDVQTVYDKTDVFDDHIDFKPGDINPGAEKQLDGFHIYVPFHLKTTVLSWKMTSKRYSQKGILTLSSEPCFHDSRQEDDGQERIVVEDYIVSK